MNKLHEGRFLDDKGRLKQWPTKHKDQLLVLAYLATKFDYDTSYTEAEVNEILKQWHTFSDWPLLRRELVDRGYLDRSPDGSNYRLKELLTDLPAFSRSSQYRTGRAVGRWVVGGSVWSGDASFDG